MLRYVNRRRSTSPRSRLGRAGVWYLSAVVRRPAGWSPFVVLIPALACNALLGNDLDGVAGRPNADGGLATSGDAVVANAPPARPRCSTTAKLSAAGPQPSHACSPCSTRTLRYDLRGLGYWAATGGGGNALDLFAGNYDDAGPMNLRDWFAQLNGVSSESVPTVSSDGLTIVFQSTRLGEPNLFVSTRSTPDLPFDAPRRLEAGRTPAQEPFVVGDSLYYASESALFVGRLRVTETRAALEDVERLAFSGASFPVVSADQREIFFGVPGSSGVLAVWYAQREDPTSDFGPPMRLDQLSDSVRDTRPSWLSPDGCHLVLTRPSADAGNEFDILSVARSL
jgi:hypothetical protein